MNYEWIYGTHTYNLCDGLPFEVKAITGIDTAVARPITEQGPLQDGDSDIDMRLEARTIQMVIQGRKTATYTHESNRELLMRMFTPAKQLGTLKLTYDNGNVYQIAARPLGNFGVGRDLITEQMLIAGITLRCPDPRWYNPNGYTVGFGLSGGGGIFAVPTPVPTPMGASVINQSITVNYAGNYREFPLFNVYGPITDPKITHLQTNRVISFAGITIASGSYYTIDLRYGRKFVYKNGVTTDIRTGETTTASQLATFALEADPTVADGANTIKVEGNTVTSVTQVYLVYFDRFSGI